MIREHEKLSDIVVEDTGKCAKEITRIEEDRDKAKAIWQDDAYWNTKADLYIKKFSTRIKYSRSKKIMIMASKGTGGAWGLKREIDASIKRLEQAGLDEPAVEDKAAVEAEIKTFETKIKAFKIGYGGDNSSWYADVVAFGDTTFEEDALMKNRDRLIEENQSRSDD